MSDRKIGHVQTERLPSDDQDVRPLLRNQIVQSLPDLSPFEIEVVVAGRHVGTGVEVRDEEAVDIELRVRGGEEVACIERGGRDRRQGTNPMAAAREATKN